MRIMAQGSSSKHEARCSGSRARHSGWDSPRDSAHFPGRDRPGELETRSVSERVCGSRKGKAGDHDKEINRIRAQRSTRTSQGSGRIATPRMLAVERVGPAPYALPSRRPALAADQPVDHASHISLPGVEDKFTSRARVSKTNSSPLSGCRK